MTRILMTLFGACVCAGTLAEDRDRYDAYDERHEKILRAMPSPEFVWSALRSQAEYNERPENRDNPDNHAHLAHIAEECGRRFPKDAVILGLLAEGAYARAIDGWVKIDRSDGHPKKSDAPRRIAALQLRRGRMLAALGRQEDASVAFAEAAKHPDFAAKAGDERIALQK